MCGIVGCAGDLSYSHEKAFRHLLILDSLRGEDSTGMLSVNKNSAETTVVKQTGDPFQLFETKKYEEAMRGSHKVLLGHNRAATVGKVTRANAHPFEFDNVIGVHNGTLTSKWKLHDQHRWDVDSQALYYHIQEKGVYDALDKMDGAWALVWWDKEEQRINFLRNKERPLFMIRSDKGKVVWWASEEWMLYAALSKNNVTYDPKDMVYFNPDVLFSFKVGDKGTLTDYLDSPAPSTYKPTYSQTTAWGSPTPPPKQEQKSNVLVIPQKEAMKDECDLSYRYKRNVHVQLLKRRVDGRGSQFFECIDYRNPSYNIRLYMYRGMPFSNYLQVEDIIIAEMGGWVIDKHYNEGYYTIVPKTIQVLDDDMDEMTKARVLGLAGFDEEGDSCAVPETKLDHNNVPLSKEAWEKRYKVCNWCNRPVFFEDKVVYSKNGDCFCEKCETDPEAMPSIQ